MKFNNACVSKIQFGTKNKHFIYPPPQKKTNGPFSPDMHKQSEQEKKLRFPFEQGKLYVRSVLHDQYGGQRFSGISTPSRYPFVMLFTGDTAEANKCDYADGWVEDDTFIYSGEGQRGDQKLTKGNYKVFNHKKLGKLISSFPFDHQAHLWHATLISAFVVSYVG